MVIIPNTGSVLRKLFQHKCMHVSLKNEYKCKSCGMWPWKVSKRPWFLAEVAVKPFWDLAMWQHCVITLFVLPFMIITTSVEEPHHFYLES
jgi:hypothetical protein